MPGGLEAAIGIATIIGIAESLDNYVRQRNYKKAMKLKKELDSIINRTNLSMSKIQSELQKAGIEYNELMERLNGVSRAGKAHEYKEKISHNYNQLQKQAKEESDRLQTIATGAMEEYQPQIDKMSNKGAIDTVLSGVEGAVNSIIK